MKSFKSIMEDAKKELDSLNEVVKQTQQIKEGSVVRPSFYEEWKKQWLYTNSVK